MRAALWPVTQPLTCDDLWRIREASAERLEIIDGELFATPSPWLMHQEMLGRLLMLATRVVDEPGLGITLLAMLDVRLANDTVVQPDLIITLADRYSIIKEWGLDGAPSLLAEIAWSPTDYRDRGIKREIYALYAVPEYWLIDPEHHCITVCSDPHGDEYRSQIVTNDTAVSATIPGLSVDLGDLFAPIPGI